jgi:hypothetical protein
MQKTYSPLFQKNSVFILVLLCSMVACDKSDDSKEMEDPFVPETADLTHLPFGGPNILIRNQGVMNPDFSSLWLCGLPDNGAGNADASDWTNLDGTWNYVLKPQVEGNVSWISEFDVSLDGNGNRIITGNALPDHPTGVFPISPSSLAYQYDGNPNIITSHEVLYVLPEIPEIAAMPSCVPFGPSGISLTGSAIYHGASTLGNDAAAHEILDRFGGHTDGTERYHYHFASDDLQDHIHTHETGHSALMGYMLDGFGIYGPHGEDGAILSSEDLDECHGHAHPVLWDGEIMDLYHYHWTYDFPYTIGCFKGTPE